MTCIELITLLRIVTNIVVEFRRGGVHSVLKWDALGYMDYRPMPIPRIPRIASSIGGSNKPRTLESSATQSYHRYVESLGI